MPVARPLYPPIADMMTERLGLGLGHTGNPSIPISVGPLEES